MSARHAVESALQRLGVQLATWSGLGLNPVTINRSVLSRDPFASEFRPREKTSRNGRCRLLRTRDRWIAINLPRREDLEMVPALLGGDFHGDPWNEIELRCGKMDSHAVLSNAHLLGIAAAALGEVKRTRAAVDLHISPPDDAGTGVKWTHRPVVVDLSALWAGPLCAALLAQAGCEVVKVESKSRPDRSGNLNDAHFQHLNRGKTPWRIDFNSSNERLELMNRLNTADVIVTSARRRGLESLGISPEACCGQNPQAIWIAITGHGLYGENANRIGFGDDCAVAGGLVAYDESRTPEFIYDAIADPLTGIRAAAIAFQALALRRGRIVDVSLSETAGIINSWIESVDE